MAFLPYLARAKSTLLGGLRRRAVVRRYLRERRRDRFEFETLEPRILLSADLPIDPA
ncbi:MAG: LEPR-XLL domain-containing protein, partial [Gammaproteobacteria bacterium]